ncbi:MULTISPECIES: DUF1641 domain-containing protein [unclassified Pseudonocardia]|uniref:DUF1641 domain-containing protein n=1 Tax=unclassified Pseudonocardia TaxID=2619320 RepID=UPI000BA18568|nr:MULTISPECIES: DUF1641 domain-containing protein [unclassified Pseudonocardia]OZM75608.1 hypothetical protein CFP66_45610 [Pseudonocardia sp. MH-G8]
MAVNGQLVARSPGSNLLQRLDDPGTAAALGRLLDHADLTTLSGGLAGAAPTINALLTSALMTDPRTATTLELLGEALVEATEADARSPTAPTGAFALLGALKAPDVGRGRGLLIQVAKTLGRKLP